MTTPQQRRYTYVVRTDAGLSEYDAASMDQAARKFAADENIRGVRNVETLLAAYERIGDGAWIWIESSDAPDGARRSS